VVLQKPEYIELRFNLIIVSIYIYIERERDRERGGEREREREREIALLEILLYIFNEIQTRERVLLL